MSTLAAIEEVLREAAVPLTVKEIVMHAGVRLPSKSRTPENVVARDLSVDLKKKGESSIFVRLAPGRYTLRALMAAGAVDVARTATPLTATALRTERAATRPALPQGRLMERAG